MNAWIESSVDDWVRKQYEQMMLMKKSSWLSACLSWLATLVFGLMLPVAQAAGPGPTYQLLFTGTLGTAKLLYMPVIFADDPIPPESPDSSWGIIANNERFFKENSYGAVDWISDVTPLIRLPQRRILYGESLGSLTSGNSSLVGDASAIAYSMGYVNQYSEYYVVFPNISEATFGGRSDGLLNGGGGALPHELGHDFGLGHANYIDTSGKNPGPTQPRAPTPPYPIDADSLIGHDDINAPVSGSEWSSMGTSMM